MAKFLFWFSPEPGHMLPTLGLARALIGRGHRVIYYTFGRVAAELEAWNFETIRSFADAGSEHYEVSITCRTEPSTLLEDKIRKTFRSDHHYYSSLRDDLNRVLRSVQPDVLIMDGIKDWRLTQGASDFYSELLKRVRIGRMCVHFRKIAPVDFTIDDVPLIFLCPEDLELPHLIDRRAVYGEPPPFHWSDSNCSLEFKPSTRHIYVTFGSQMGRYPQLEKMMGSIAAIAESDLNLSFVLNLDRASESWSTRLGRCSRLVELGSHQRCLEQASVLVCHGGLGTVKDAIRAKVPMIIVPQMWDQPMNASRVVHHELGLSLDPAQVTPDNLKSKLDSIPNSEVIRRGLRIMNRAFHQSAERQLVVDFCESLAN